MSKSRRLVDKIFCLKQVPLKEADSLFIVFSRSFGKTALIAKGIRKIKSRNRGNIMPAFISQVTLYKASGMPILIESSLENGFEFINKDAEYINRILFLLKNFLPENVPEVEIFDYLEEFIRNNKLNDYNVNKFRIFVLKKLGFLHDFRFCSICFNNKSDFMSLKDFSTYCKSCYTESDKYIVSLKNLKYSSRNLTLALDEWIKKLVWN